MKRLRPLSLLVALALLAGQWVAVAHAAEHANSQADDALCAVCIQVHNLEQAEHGSHATISFAQPVQAPARLVIFAVLDAALPQSNIRAPPSLL